MYQFFDVNPSIITAVISSGERDIMKLSQIKALSTIVQNDGFKEMFSTFKRVANIIKNMEIQENLLVNVSLFGNAYETELHKRF